MCVLHIASSLRGLFRSFPSEVHLLFKKKNQLAFLRGRLMDFILGKKMRFNLFEIRD